MQNVKFSIIFLIVFVHNSRQEIHFSVALQLFKVYIIFLFGLKVIKIIYEYKFNTFL